MKTSLEYAELAPVIRRLESALAIERQTLAGFLSDMADQFEANQAEIGYQAILMDHRRADRDMTASSSPKDYYRRLGKWVGPAWRAWTKQTALRAAQRRQRSGAKRASIRLRPDRPGIEGVLAVTRSERIRCPSKGAADAPCDTQAFAQVVKPNPRIEWLASRIPESWRSESICNT